MADRFYGINAGGAGGDVAPLSLGTFEGLAQPAAVQELVDDFLTRCPKDERAALTERGPHLLEVVRASDSRLVESSLIQALAQACPDVIELLELRPK
jgi:hypothetical protein